MPRTYNKPFNPIARENARSGLTATLGGTMRLAIAFILLTLSTAASASQESILTLDKLLVGSAGIGESGAVKVSGSQTPSGVTALSIEAFGRSMQLTAAQLKALDGGQYNSIQLSYEDGYKELGGRTIYIKLSKAFTSGQVVSAFVVVTEDGKVKVTKSL